MATDWNPGFYAGRATLVTGGTGLIGRPLVRFLVEAGARVRVASLREPIDPCAGVEYVVGDLMSREFCASSVREMDYVFHLASVKGSVGLGRRCSADFFVKPLLMNTHMMEEARKADIARYLFASSVCVYPPAPVFVEDGAWAGPPQPADMYAGWAKRMGELQASAYREQYDWAPVAIVRLVNTYGPYDDFDPRTAQVIPALIARTLGGEDPLRVWGDGSAVRDFLHCRDAALGMLLALERAADATPVNLGSGVGYSVRAIVEAVVDASGLRPRVEWDTSRPAGEPYRVADIARARVRLGFEPAVGLREGIAETVTWYREHRARLGSRPAHFNLDATRQGVSS
jgi:GDP-L-fucose synthase